MTNVPNPENDSGHDRDAPRANSYAQRIATSPAEADRLHATEVPTA